MIFFLNRREGQQNVLGTLSKVKDAKFAPPLKRKVYTNRYIRPEVKISLEATTVTDITCVGVITIALKKKCVPKNMHLN